MNTFQIIIIALLYALVACVFPNTLDIKTYAYVQGLLIGIVLGDWKTGLILGATIQTLNMAPVTTGATVNYDLASATFVAVPLAMSTGLDSETALALAVPFAVLGTFFTPLERTVNGVNAYFGDKAAAKGDARGMGLSQVFVPWLNVPLRFISMFAILYAGSAMIDSIIAYTPQWVLNGFQAASKLLPAVGVAMFLNLIGKKSLLLFFFLGYYIAYSMGVATMVMVVFGIIIALLCVNGKAILSTDESEDD